MADWRWVSHGLTSESSLSSKVDRYQQTLPHGDTQEVCTNLTCISSDTNVSTEVYIPGLWGQKKGRPLPGERTREGQVCLLWAGSGRIGMVRGCSRNMGTTWAKAKRMGWWWHAWEEGAAAFSPVMPSFHQHLSCSKGERMHSLSLGTKQEITSTFGHLLCVWLSTMTSYMCVCVYIYMYFFYPLFLPRPSEVVGVILLILLVAAATVHLLQK